MAITRQTYKVYYEDDTEQEVVSDQRDIAAWEKFSGMSVLKARDTALVIFGRQVAYFALKRTNSLPVPGQTTVQWEKTVIEVEAIRDEQVDPTSAEASSTGPSESPSTVAKASASSATP